MALRFNKSSRASNTLHLLNNRVSELPLVDKIFVPFIALFFLPASHEAKQVAVL